VRGAGDKGFELSPLFAIHTPQIAVSPLVAIHSKNGRGGVRLGLKRVIVRATVKVRNRTLTQFVSKECGTRRQVQFNELINRAPPAEYGVLGWRFVRRRRGNLQVVHALTA
jgi:hypothetical protein